MDFCSKNVFLKATLLITLMLLCRTAVNEVNWVIYDGPNQQLDYKYCESTSFQETYQLKLCDKCIQNFVIDGSFICRRQDYDRNCIGFDFHLDCFVCRNGYFLEAVNKCTPKTNNCLNYDPDNKVCLQCDDGYALNNTVGFWKIGEGNCFQATIKNCQQYSAPDVCSKCVDGFRLFNNQCLQNISFCQSHIGNACQKCISGYSLNSMGICEQAPQISNCQLQEGFICRQCQAGYQMSNNLCVYQIQFCIQVIEKKCQFCLPGYQVTSQGTCEIIPPIQNCIKQNDSVCNACAKGYNLSMNQCVYQIPNCLKISGQTCVQCISGYLVNLEGKCSEIIQIQNCMTQTGKVCEQCVNEYDLINNQCIYHIDYCLKVNGTVCEVCFDGYQISTEEGICIEKQVSYDPHCRVFDETAFSKCLQCSQSFYLGSKGLCELVDPLCKTYNMQNGKCMSCYLGYSLSEKQGRCFQRVEVLLNNNCHKFDFQNNVCLKCSQGSYIDEFGVCQKHSDPLCKKPSANFTTCDECYKGYIYSESQNRCVVGNYNCASWKNGKCESCPKGFYLNQNFNCTQIDPFCKNYNPVAKRCMICYPGYVLDTDFECKVVEKLSPAMRKYHQNCAKHDQNNQCIQCYYGYYLSLDQEKPFCAKVSDFCRTYSRLTGKCTSCYFGYYKSQEGECLRFF